MNTDALRADIDLNCFAPFPSGMKPSVRSAERRSSASIRVGALSARRRAAAAAVTAPAAPAAADGRTDPPDQ